MSEIQGIFILRFVTGMSDLIDYCVWSGPSSGLSRSYQFYLPHLCPKAPPSEPSAGGAGHWARQVVLLTTDSPDWIEAVSFVFIFKFKKSVAIKNNLFFY